MPGRGGHRQDVVDVEPVEGHPLDVAEPPEVRDELGEVDVALALGRAVGDGDSDRTMIDRRQHVLDELARAAIGPVQVVDHEQQRPPARGLAQPPGDRFRQSVTEGVRVGGEWLGKSGHGFDELGEDEPQIARTGTELVGRAGHEAKERSERLGERLVGPAHPVVATPVQDDGTVARRPPSHLACEPRLPDARLTADQHAASATCGGVDHGAHHGRQLVMAAGEREQLAAVQRLGEDPARRRRRRPRDLPRLERRVEALGDDRHVGDERRPGARPGEELDERGAQDPAWRCRRLEPRRLDDGRAVAITAARR